MIQTIQQSLLVSFPSKLSLAAITVYQEGKDGHARERGQEAGQVRGGPVQLQQVHACQAERRFARWYFLAVLPAPCSLAEQL